MNKIKAPPVMKNLPAGRLQLQAIGSDRSGRASIPQLHHRASSRAWLLVFAVLVLLYKRFISPLVNMSFVDSWPPLGGLLALLILGQPI